MLTDLQKIINFYEIILMWNHKVKINVLFYSDKSWTIALRQMNFGTVKYHGRIYKFCLTKVLNMEMLRIFEVILGQALKHFV
jgi:hypothetical protein